MNDVPDKVTLPYDLQIKKEKEEYKKKHKKFNTDYIYELDAKGFRSDEIAKIIGRSEAFVINCFKK